MTQSEATGGQNDPATGENSEAPEKEQQAEDKQSLSARATATGRPRGCEPPNGARQLGERTGPGVSAADVAGSSL